METSDTFGFLLGTWRVTRFMDDHWSKSSGTFEGVASLVMQPEEPNCPTRTRARYEEAGEFHFGSYNGTASRSLYYERADGAAAMLYFADGRPFVELDLTSGQWQAIHVCGNDRYQIETRVQSADTLNEIWRVRGPMKSYDAMTTLTRLG